MKYQSDKIEEVLKATTVAASAGFATADWANHVFTRYGEDDFVGNSNIGRLPVVIIREVEGTYTFEAEPGHFGTRDSSFVIRIIVPTFNNRSEERWKQLQRIKQAVMQAVTTELTIGATDVQVGAPIITQFSIYQDVTLSTASSYDKNYEENN